MCLVCLQLCAGASAEQRVKWRLLPAREYHYLNQSTCFELQGVDNAEEFKVRNAAWKSAFGILSIW